MAPPVRFAVGSLLAVLALAALGALLPPWSGLRQAMVSVSPHLWLGVLAAFLASYLLRALRLQAEWAGRRWLGLGECLHLTLVHSAAVNLLPMRAGEAGYPLLLRARWGVPLADAMLSLLWLRLQDAVVLAAWALVAFGDGTLPLRCSVALSFVLAVAALLPMAARRWGAGAPWAWARRCSAAVLRGGHVGWLYAVANWTLKLVALGLLLSALAALPPEVGWAGALGGELAAVMPVQAPGGAGTYEAGVWLAVALAAGGAVTLPPLADVLGAALIVHGFVLAVSTAGALAARAVSGLRPALRERLP